MQRYLARRLLMALVVIFAMTIVAFACIHIIPGDVVDIMLGTHATPEAAAALRHRLGLDQPLLQQYLRWVRGLLRGDLGQSMRSQESVAAMLRERLPVTIELTLLGTLIALALGLPAGIVAAVKRYSLGDQLLTLLAMAGLSMPDFWLATLLVLLFSVTWVLLPSGGLLPRLFSDAGGNLKRMILPALALGLPSAAVHFRMMRSSMLEVIRSDYMRTAYSKGLDERRALLIHALKNAMVPVMTVIGLEVTWMLGGSFIIETIFALPGLGRATVQAIRMRDFVVLQGCLLAYSLIVVGISLAVDVIYAWLDPRIRYN